MPEPQTALAAAQAHTAAAALQPTLAEHLTAFGQTAWNDLMALDARAAALNLVLSASVALVAFGMIWLLRRLFDRWFARFEPSAGEARAANRGGPHKAAGVTWGLLRLLVLAGAVLTVMSIWCIDPWAWL